ncbi:hypothetical protein AV903_24140 [Erwinia tracheiphila]|uniref:Uncharacterized protein n=1 Tax=Erwinia tracheiphila TaxID=65700 RepID=A0A345CY78_9GAMM|nr:hypothetical protein AV903_24140 [Erwinia tracheiphila]
MDKVVVILLPAGRYGNAALVIQNSDMTLVSYVLRNCSVGQIRNVFYNDRFYCDQRQNIQSHS